MRLFIGLDLPPHIKSTLSQILKSDTRDYHITLLFIGATDISPGEFKKRLANIDFKPFEVTINGFATFPKGILYLSLAQSDELQALKGKVQLAFPEYEGGDTRLFVPHITVQRHYRSEDGFPEITPQIFKVEHLSLFKSEKDSSDRKYHVL